jgi:hypothetical protein
MTQVEWLKAEGIYNLRLLAFGLSILSQIISQNKGNRDSPC